MTAMNKVIITQIIEEWSMIYVHALREDKRATVLKPGEAILAFNRKLDMARLVDCTGTVHTFWAEEGQQFDLSSISSLMEKGFFVNLGRRNAKGKTGRPLKIAA